MEISSFTHTGMVRKNNEDSFLIIPPWSGIAIDKEVCLFAVADGMGGQNAGEVASAIVVEAAGNWVRSKDSINVCEEEIEELFSLVNQEVWDYSQKHAETKGMGTTLTLVLMNQTKAIVGHVGDTRLYLLRDSSFDQLTKDHSLVAEQVKIGKITQEAARTHPARHILSRVVGGRQFIKPDVFELEVQSGDRFLICSDGIYGMVEEVVIEEIVKNNPLKVASKKLVQEANQCGGKDNSTVILVDIEKFPQEFPGKLSLGRIKKIISHWGETGIK